MERNYGRFWCSVKKDNEKKVLKDGIPILRVVAKPTISLREVNEWRESKGKQPLS
jgi:hypothetical protein